MSRPIKSSIELAMEKLAKLPKLTKEEIRERQEREFRPLGQSLARRFLSGALAASRLEVELFKHEGDRGEIVRKAFSEFLCQAIDLEDAATSAKALEAIEALVEDDYPEEKADRLQVVLQDYTRRKQQELATLLEAESACLRDLGISGSAIRLNPRENEAWRQRASELQRASAPEADQLKQELTDHLISSLRERS